MKQYVVAVLDEDDNDGKTYIGGFEVFDRLDQAIKDLKINAEEESEMILYELVPLKKARTTVEVIDV